MTDMEIAHKIDLKPIYTLANQYGIASSYIEPYGMYKAKLSLELLNHRLGQARPRYILVSAITPTTFGEGKTLTTIGLSLSLNRLKKKAICVIRQASLGLVFGIKGSAAGGGYSQVLPIEEINLHLTGDTHAIGYAHNLLSAFIDNHIYHRNSLNIDPVRIDWPRVIDINDRFLRSIYTGLGSREDGFPRASSFAITATSEVMAIVALSRDFKDLSRRLKEIIIGESISRQPVRVRDIGIDGAMAVVLKDVLKPNLMQTTENTPALIHTGAFANISHGCSSIVADYIGLGIADYVVTEAGFGADCGAEKFLDIKCRYSGLHPDVVVLVCTLRALKEHGDGDLKKGCANLKKHIDNLHIFGLPVVVAINRFATDRQEELERLICQIRQFTEERVVIAELWQKGGLGGEALAQAVIEAIDKGSNFRFLYDLDLPIKEKIEKIAFSIYGADAVSYTPEVEDKITQYTEWGYSRLPICMAKTGYSLSHNPRWKGLPTGWTLPITNLRLCSGAGYIIALCDGVRTMPGLPRRPNALGIDIDEQGRIIGMF